MALRDPGDEARRKALARARKAFDDRRKARGDSPRVQQTRELQAIRRELKEVQRGLKAREAEAKREKTKRDREQARLRRERSSQPGRLQRGAEAVREKGVSLLAAVGRGLRNSRLATSPFEAGIEFRTQLIKNKDFIEESVIDSAAALARALPFVAVLDRRVAAVLQQQQDQLLQRILSDEILGNIAVRLQEDPVFQRFAARTAAREFKNTDEFRRIQQMASGQPGPPS